MLVVLLRKQIIILQLQKLNTNVIIMINHDKYITNTEFNTSAEDIFQPLFRHFKLNASTGHISSSKSNGLSAETINCLLHQILVLIPN